MRRDHAKGSLLCRDGAKILVGTDLLDDPEVVLSQHFEPVVSEPVGLRSSVISNLLSRIKKATDPKNSYSCCFFLLDQILPHSET